MKKHVGFTGSQKGMTKEQQRNVKDILSNFAPCVVHHSDCIGADDQFHTIAKKMHCDIEIHPPDKDGKRAFCESQHIHDEKPYLARNHDIVNASDFMIAAPSNTRMQLRSGTWATIRYARNKRKHLFIVFPDGNVTEEA